MKNLFIATGAIAFAALAYTGEAKAESCPWDMVWDRAKGDCVYYQPGNGGSGSTTTTNNNGAQAGAIAGSNATGGNGYGGAGGQGGNATQGQQQGQSQAASANNRINIDNRTRQSAAQAAPVIMGGYGPANCFGDTNPSGQFGASMQVFGWGVSANSSKASNVCAIAQIAGPAAAVAYLQRMDPNMPRNVTVMQPTGRVTCPATHPIYVEGKGCRK